MAIIKQNMIKKLDKCIIVMVASTVFPKRGTLIYFKRSVRFKEDEMSAFINSYGLSQTQIADVLERDVRTLEEWLQAIGKIRYQFHIFICITLKLKLLFLQMDELWSFCKAKSHQLWGFIAFEATSKFWSNEELGSRTNHTASRLVAPVKRFGDFSVGTLKIT